MPRRAHPWYRRGSRMWYGTVEGKKKSLGVKDENDEAGAIAAHRRLIEETARAAAALIAPPSVQSATVAEGIARYRGHVEKRVALGKVKPKTAYDYEFALEPFVEEFGAMPATSLTAEAVEDWADGFGWSQSTINSYLGTIQTALKWCRVIVRIRRPPKESRGADTVLTDEQFAAVMNAASRGNYDSDFRTFLRTLRETGARPNEVAQLEASSIDWPNSQARIREHKTRRHTGKDRVLVFSDAAMALLETQRAKHGTGLLFRTRNGNAFQARYIGRECRTISKRVGFRVIAYGFRHAYATKALAAGVADAIVAELLGHRGTAMIHAHYSHLSGQSRTLRDAAERVSRAAG